jgi:hypothetical protein
MMAVVVVLAALPCSLGANWSMTTPNGPQEYAQTSLVSGAGVASGVGDQATFYFAQKDDNDNWTNYGMDTVVGVPYMNGALWSQTLDPNTEQPNTRKWPASKLTQAGRLRDYKTRIEGATSNAEVVDHRVSP